MNASAKTSSLKRGQFTGTVLANKTLCREHYRLTLHINHFPSAEPGQFVQVLCRKPADQNEHEIDWQPGQRITDWTADLEGPAAFLRRPFSLAGCRRNGTAAEVDLIHRAVGVATNWLCCLKEGDEVGILGPLGNTFTLPQPNQPAILVGGGVGIPPMLYLAERLAGRPAVAFCGTLRRELLPLTVRLDTPAAPRAFEPTLAIEEFARHGIPTVISTDDGSFGFQGYITQALEHYLDSALSTQHPAPSTQHSPILYTCGPEPMMRRVADIALSRGLECQVAAERAMACGMGTCQSCCIRLKKPDPALPPLAGKDWCYRLTCTDGPVFQASDLLW
jgi:dihydroorotate dehydrogenase electron transfer subunit